MLRWGRLSEILERKPLITCDLPAVSKHLVLQRPYA